MKKITCRACSATNDDSNEFCISCGEWIVFTLEKTSKIDVEPENTNIKKRVPQLKCSNCKLLNLPSQKLCKGCSQPLIKPLSEYGAMSLPKKSDVPGIRAVFLLTLIIPLIALASYYYNSNISEEVIQEIEIVTQSTTTSSTTTVPSLLEKHYPVSCTSSSSYDESYGCEKLYDGTDSTWQDNKLSCNDAELTFQFSKDINIEFIVYQNIKESRSFTRNFKARDIEISTTEEGNVINYELANSNVSDWITINQITDTLTLKILSSYPGEEYSGSQPFEECAIQEITFYGRG